MTSLESIKQYYRQVKKGTCTIFVPSYIINMIIPIPVSFRTVDRSIFDIRYSIFQPNVSVVPFSRCTIYMASLVSFSQMGTIVYRTDWS